MTSDLLRDALTLHQAGRLEDAARRYQDVLSTEPQHADALHLLGVLRHQQGQPDRAVELIGRAVVLLPGVAPFHSNLAEAYRALGQLERAVGCCRTALRLAPDYPEAACNLGMALHDLGRDSEAVEHLRHAIALRPDFATAHNNLGMVLRELGEHEQALAHFRTAVELAPEYAPARTNLSLALLEHGQLDEALRHAEEAVRLQADTAALHHNLGNVLLGLGKPVEARAAFMEALRLDPDLAAALDRVAATLEEEGKHEAAIPWLRQAIELEPENADHWEHLASLHSEQECWAEVVRCYDRVLQLRPTAAAHVGAGWGLQEQGRLEEARQHFEMAVGLDPQGGAGHLNLGGLHEELGDMTLAEGAFREALQLQPEFALAHARLATLLRGKLPDADLAAVERRAGASGLADGPRARLLFGLAQVYDGRGDHARAAECLEQANALACSEASRRHRTYDPTEHERFVTNLISHFTQDLFDRLAGAGTTSNRPGFVLGLPRSGTTLIEQVLGSHSRVHAAGELRFGRQTFEAIPHVVGADLLPLPSLPLLDAAGILRLADQHLDSLAALDGGRCAVVVDKMPDNYLYLGLLAILFPHATFIHCRRDLRDVAVSCWMTDFRSIRWANDPGHIASRFTQYRRIMAHWQAVLPRKIHEVDYEDTVTDLEGVARRLVAACGLEWEPGCQAFYENKRPVRTASLTQVRQPVYRKSVGRWKNYECALRDLFALLPPPEDSQAS
jgi:tetratricopeptide (TPR) repeat protein